MYFCLLQVLLTLSLHSIGYIFILSILNNLSQVLCRLMILMFSDDSFSLFDEPSIHGAHLKVISRMSLLMRYAVYLGLESKRSP